MSEEQVRNIIRAELANLIYSDRYMIGKTLQMQDGRNIQLGLSTGTKIGISGTEKLAFYGNTPIVQKGTRPLSVAGITTDLKSWGFYSPSS